MARKDDKLDPTEFQALQDWLVSQGFKRSDLNSAIGSTVNDRSRQQIASDLAKHLKKSKKKA